MKKEKQINNFNFNSKDNSNNVKNLDEDEYKLANLTGLKPIFFKNNFDRFMENLNKNFKQLNQKSVIFIQGGNEIPRHDTDTVFFTFYQNPNFYYLTGLNEPGFTLVIDVAKKERFLFMIMPDEKKSIYQRVPSLEEISKNYEIQCKKMDEIWEFIKNINPEKIYRLSGVNSDSKRKVETSSFNPPEPYNKLIEKLDDNTMVWELLSDTRVIKSDEEINLIRYAVNVCCNIHKEIIKNIEPGKNERNIEMEFSKLSKKELYTRELPYGYISASGKNSCIIHYDNNDSVMDKSGLILMDMGLKLAGYCVDITSTVPVNGKFSQYQKNIYNIVLEANRNIINEIKPGKYWTTLHLFAEKIILKGLQKYQLLSSKYTVEEMLEKRVSYYFFPHGLGHFIGLDNHDVGGYLSFTPVRPTEKGMNKLRTSRLLMKNMVLTVEPGIYFNEYLLNQAFNDPNVNKYFVKEEILKNYINIGGIRIEDMVVVKENGCEVLSYNLVRKTEEIEELMRK